MFDAVIGHSQATDPQAAVSEVLAQCRQALQGRSPGAGVFHTSCMDCDHAALLALLDQAFPEAAIVGCTTDGEVSSRVDFALQSFCLILFVAWPGGPDFVTGVARGFSANPEASLAAALAEARAKSPRAPGLALVYPDGMSTIKTPLDTVLGEVFGATPVFGGTAGDNYRLQKTLQFYGAEVLTDALPFLLVCGEVPFAAGACSGWTPVGERMRVTSSVKNVVRTIDDKPAVELYRHYLGDDTEAYPQFPLAVFDQDPERFNLRDPMFINHADGSLQFIGHVPEGAQVQLTEVGRDGILTASDAAVRQALKSYPGPKPRLCLIYSCTSRRHILGTHTAEECRLLRPLRDEGLDYFGFYTYGEIATLPGETVSYHNDTYVVLML